MDGTNNSRARQTGARTASAGAGALRDAERAVWVARRVRAQARRCWRNAAMAVRYLGESGRYVEGWIVVGRGRPLVVEHGWCEVDGVVVDPTYTPAVTPLPEPLAYFGGCMLSAAAADAGLRRGDFPLAARLRDPAYHLAFEAAFLDTRMRTGPHPVLPETTVVHCRREPFDVFIGRSGRWGNPYRIGPDGSREDVLLKFREWLMRHPGLLSDLDHLRGKRLGCFCAPDPCHGDVLARLADFGFAAADGRNADNARQADAERFLATDPFSTTSGPT